MVRAVTFNMVVRPVTACALRCILTKCFVHLRTFVSAHIQVYEAFACAAETLKFAEAAKKLSKSGTTQFPGEGNAIAYAVQDSTGASDMLHSILNDSVWAVGAMLHCRSACLNLQELLRNQPAGHISCPSVAPWNAGHLAPFRFTRRPVGDLDIKIKIAYCGICHTDLHQMRNDWKNSLYPMVPGCALSLLKPYTHIALARSDA